MRHSKPRRSARLTRTGAGGALVAAAATAAVATVASAAVLLSTSVTGNATINTVPASPTSTTTPAPTTPPAPAKPAVVISVSGNQNGGLDCRQVGVSGDYKTLTFKPVLTRTQGEAAKAETCTVTLKVRNTGNTLIHLDDTASQLAGPDGWTTSKPTGDAVTSEIKPAEVKTAAITVTAGPAAKEGAFSGQIVWADNS